MITVESLKKELEHHGGVVHRDMRGPVDEINGTRIGAVSRKIYSHDNVVDVAKTLTNQGKNFAFYQFNTYESGLQIIRIAIW
jgi:hypothetical protein